MQVDLVSAGLRMQLGETLHSSDFPHMDHPVQYASSTNLVPVWHAPRALLSEFSAPLDVITSDPSYFGHCFLFKAGVTLRLPPEASQYLGWLGAKGATRAEAEANLQRLTNMVKYSLAEVPTP